MENAALPILNLVILGAFMAAAMVELKKLSNQAIRIREDEGNS